MSKSSKSNIKKAISVKIPMIWKSVLCKNRYCIVVVTEPNFYLSKLSSLFLAFFCLRLQRIFLRNTPYRVLPGHTHLFVYFSFTFMKIILFVHPISCSVQLTRSNSLRNSVRYKRNSNFGSLTDISLADIRPSYCVTGKNAKVTVTREAHLNGKLQGMETFVHDSRFVHAPFNNINDLRASLRVTYENRLVARYALIIFSW